MVQLGAAAAGAGAVGVVAGIVGVSSASCLTLENYLKYFSKFRKTYTDCLV